MDELIGRLAAEAGIGSAVSGRPVGIMPGFLRNKGASDKVQILIIIDEIQSAACKLFRLDRDKAGAGQIGEIIKGTPGLSQFA